MLPAELAAAYDAFQRCAGHINLAQRAMIRCVPSSPRSTPLPLDAGAQTLRISLADARRDLAGWRRPEVEDVWLACAAALEETLISADAAIERAATTRELEVALAAVSDLLDPLHAFVDAQARFASLRRRR